MDEIPKTDTFKRCEKSKRKFEIQFNELQRVPQSAESEALLLTSASVSSQIDDIQSHVK